MHMDIRADMARQPPLQAAAHMPGASRSKASSAPRLGIVAKPLAPCNAVTGADAGLVDLVRG